jgi:DNA-directed RNA polymerase subunit M/transcription elongation factor TFIIS
MTAEHKPGNQEEEYFKREDAERIRKLHAEEIAKATAGERAEMKKAHEGRCSSCGALMVPEQAGQVRILHCPACGGAFLEKATWDFIHAHAEPHSVMGAVLNWFRSANKP